MCHPTPSCPNTVRVCCAAQSHLLRRAVGTALTSRGWVRMHAGLNLKMNHEFVLAELPVELAAVLGDYDVDNSGSVSVAELVAGAQLMRQQVKKVRRPLASLFAKSGPPHAPRLRVQNKLMTKIVIALTVLLLLLLAGNFGLVWAVVVYNTPTTLSSNVLTAKATGDPVQVSSADFYYDSNGMLQLRNRGAQVPMDWIGSAPSCGSDTCTADAGGSTGRRRLLQDTGSAAPSAAPTTVDMQTTQFTPTCNFSSPDFYTNSSYFFTGTCTFTKLVQMRTIVLPMLSSKTTAQVGGSIFDTAAWKDGPQTVYKGCYTASSPASSNWNSTVLNSSTSLANCETLAVQGADAESRPYTFFGFTGVNTSTTGICYACAAFSASCAPFQNGLGTCSNTANIRVFQVLRSPNRYQISGPGAMANSPIPIPGGSPAAPAWSYVTLTITRVDYVKNVFRDASNTLTICQANLLRFYVAPMTASGSVTSVNGGASSYVDVCLTSMSKAASFGAGSTTWIGNYTVHSTGLSTAFKTNASVPAYYDRPSVGASFATPSNTDFQSVLSYFCTNCPSGPFIDYSNLQYDANLFELPCTVKGIAWRYRDVYSNQGCPAWDPTNPSAQSSCTWTTAETSNYGGQLGSKYCIQTIDAFTPNEKVYTFDNQLSFLPNTGRLSYLVQKTQTAPGDSGVPPLYLYNSGNNTFGPLWRDYFNTSDEADKAVSGFSWFTSSRSSSFSMASSRRHLLQDPTTTGAVTFPGGATYDYLGVCLSIDQGLNNNWNITSGTRCTCGSSCNSKCKNMGSSYSNSVFPNYPKICRCANVVENGVSKVAYCTGTYPFCRSSGTGAGCYNSATGVPTPSNLYAS